MKHLTILSTALLFSIVILIVLLVTIPIASAQTATQLRPGTTDVTNTRSITPIEIQKIVPKPELFENTKDVRRVEAQKINVVNLKTEVRETGEEVKNETPDQPRTFLEKARDAIRKRTQNIDNTQDSKEERLKNGEVRKEAVTEKLKERQTERASKFLDNIERKMNAAISRLKTLSERIASRIVKFEERGIDMTEANLMLETAKEHIRNAEESVTNAILIAKESLNTDASRDSFGGVVSELAKSKGSLKEAHKSLVQVIRTMKASISDSQTNKNETDNDESENNEVN